MKKTISRVIVITAIIILAGGFLVKRAFFSTGLTHHHEASAEKALYYCPMHPNYTSDKPGSCPICGMNLVKKTPDENSAHLNQSSSAGLNLRYGKNERANPGAPKVFTVAELMKMKPGEVCLLHKCKHGTCLLPMTEASARAGKCPHCGEDLGVIVKDLAPQGYTTVKLSPEKQRLVGLKTAAAKEIEMTKTIRAVGRVASDPDLYSAEQEYLISFENYQRAIKDNDTDSIKQAETSLEVSRSRMKLMGLNDDMLRELEKAGRPDRSLLYSEAGGHVWLYVPLYQEDVLYVKPGDRAEVTFPEGSAEAFEGRVRSMDPIFDPVSRSLRVRISLDNPKGLLKPEMYMNVLFRVSLGKALAVPEEAVFATGEKNILFVVTDGRFEPREVVLGAKAEGMQAIQSGLRAGETVVVSGNFLIDSESRLKAALSGMSGAGEHPHT